jgi:hypothetical protein
VPRYRVLVDDNFHYMNADERRQAGVYKTVDKALAVCRRIVDRSLEQMYRRGMSPKEEAKKPTSGRYKMNGARGLCNPSAKSRSWTE